MANGGSEEFVFAKRRPPLPSLPPDVGFTAREPLDAANAARGGVLAGDLVAHLKATGEIVVG